MDFCATHSLKAAAGERGLAVHFASPIHFDSLHSWWQEDTEKEHRSIHMHGARTTCKIFSLNPRPPSHLLLYQRTWVWQLPLEFTSLAVLHLHTWNLLSICEYTYTQQTSIQATYSPIWLDCTHGCRGIIKSPYGFMWIGVDYQVLQYEWHISVTAEGERLPLMLFKVSCQFVPHG